MSERNASIGPHQDGQRPGDAAVVGMACRFPGAPDLAAFWSNVLARRSAVGALPASGYLDASIGFDPDEVAVPTTASDGNDPEQVLTLDAARRALSDAGLADGPPKGVRVEVIVGRENGFDRESLIRLQHGRIVAQTLAILRALHPDWTEADLEAVRDDLSGSL